MGSAITTVITYFVMMVVSYQLGQKKYPIPYDLKNIAFYLIFSIILSSFYFYGNGNYNFRENYWVGISLILMFVFVIYKKEKTTILKLLKK
jgi:hypothetical protein